MLTSFTSLSTLVWLRRYHKCGSFEVDIWLHLHPSISTALMRPRRPKQYCLQLVIYIYIYMSGFMKTVSKTACTKIAGMILGNRSDSVHKYGHVVLRVLSTLCTLNRSYTIPMQGFEIVANESKEPNKAKLEL